MNPEITTKLLKVTLKYEDKIMTLEGEEAEKWNNHNLAVAQCAQLHNMNPFLDDPIKWNISPNKEKEEQEIKRLEDKAWEERREIMYKAWKKNKYI